MGSQSSTVARPNRLVENADSVLASVRGELARPRGDRPSEPALLDERLSELGEELRALVRKRGADPTKAASLEPSNSTRPRRPIRPTGPISSSCSSIRISDARASRSL